MQKKIFSPLKYIREKGRKLPIEKCLVFDSYHEMGLTICLIIRKQPSGLFTFAQILVDRHCLGVKNAMANCNFTAEKITELLERHTMPFTEVSPVYFHNLVYGAVDYASNLGFSPHKDFQVAEFILEPSLIDDGIDEIEMGWKGKPYYIAGPSDNTPFILSKLNKSVGPAGYDMLC